MFNTENRFKYRHQGFTKLKNGKWGLNLEMAGQKRISLKVRPSQKWNLFRLSKGCLRDRSFALAEVA